MPTGMPISSPIHTGIMALADSRHLLHFVHAVVQDPDKDIRSIAADKQIPKTSAYRIAQVFRFHGAIRRKQTDPRRVIRLTADLRKDRAVPDLSLQTEDLPGVLDAIAGFRHHLAFASAANAIARFEPAETAIRLHIKSPSELAFLDAFRHPGGRSTLHFYADDLDRYPEPIKVQRSPVCDPIITLVDLHSHPRAGAHADFLDRALTRAGTLPERP